MTELSTDAVRLPALALRIPTIVLLCQWRVSVIRSSSSASSRASDCDNRKRRSGNAALPTTRSSTEPSRLLRLIRRQPPLLVSGRGVRCNTACVLVVVARRARGDPATGSRGSKPTTLAVLSRRAVNLKKAARMQSPPRLTTDRGKGSRPAVCQTRRPADRRRRR